ncbi:DUF1707 domain-containing protein [Geodermatophilus sp. SYSU D01105]
MTSEAAPDPDRPPVVRVSDTDREATVTRLQTALAEGRIDLYEFGDRVEGVYASVTTADLDRLVADLPVDAPPPVEIVGTRVPETMTSVFGDIKVEGTADVPRDASTVFGDIRLDLRNLRTDAERIDLVLGTVFGDVDVIVAEGVDAEISGWTVFGDRKTQLAPVPRVAGTPRVVVRARTVFGDLKLRSLAPGESPSRWRAVMDRLAQRHLPPPPPPAPLSRPGA